ncbi:MAG: phage tail assembly protein [Planctomycetota bacterium]|jgi:hypothetical protein
MAFQTKFEFTLPKGYVDKEGKVHRKGVMRLATAKDEIAPLTDPRVQKSRAYLVIILLARVIDKLGDMKDVTTDVVENLFSADLSYLQDIYRRINEDGTTVVAMRCPHCAQDFDYDLGMLGE